MRKKTTVYLDADAYRRLKLLARARNRPPAKLVREAVIELHRAPRALESRRERRGLPQRPR